MIPGRMSDNKKRGRCPGCGRIFSYDKDLPWAECPGCGRTFGNHPPLNKTKEMERRQRQMERRK